MPYIIAWWGGVDWRRPYVTGALTGGPALMVTDTSADARLLCIVAVVVSHGLMILWHGQVQFSIVRTMAVCCIAMKCISLINAVFLWIVIVLIVWAFVPSSAAIVHNNAGWIVGLTLSAWWLYGYVTSCNRTK